MRNFFRGVFVIFFLMTASNGASASIGCGDFLRGIASPPDTIEFVGCESEPTKQGAPLTALYRVKGKDALAAELYLDKKMGVTERMKFVCCVWEVRGETYYEDKNTGLGYHIRMGSEETIHNKREEWSKIGYFYITVVHLREPL
ncbi:DUF4952 domain-containing protein [Pseudomonas saponiphila]